MLKKQIIEYLGKLKDSLNGGDENKINKTIDDVKDNSLFLLTEEKTGQHQIRLSDLDYIETKVIGKHTVTLRKLNDTETVVFIHRWGQIGEPSYEEPFAVIGVEDDGNNLYKLITGDYAGSLDGFLRDCMNGYLLG